METPGPPPLTNEVINEIPISHITKEQFETNLQCSICWDNYEIGEVVKKLPCEHFYHDYCIVPWLELHGTCPICREKLYEFDALLSDDDSGEGRAAFMRYANENLSRESSSLSISSMSWTAEIFGNSLSSFLQGEDETSLHSSQSSSEELATYTTLSNEQLCNGAEKSSSSSSSSSSASSSSSRSFIYVYPEGIQSSTQLTGNSEDLLDESLIFLNTNVSSSSESDYLEYN